MNCIKNYFNRKIGLIMAAGTRMGGYAVCLLRKLRLKAALEECVTKPEFRNLPKGQKPPDWMIKLIKDEHYWDRTYQMLRALYGPYRVLRLCDTQAAVMDKV
jgi:hypothetical protein